MHTFDIYKMNITKYEDCLILYLPRVMPWKVLCLFWLEWNSFNTINYPLQRFLSYWRNWMALVVDWKPNFQVGCLRPFVIQFGECLIIPDQPAHSLADMTGMVRTRLPLIAIKLDLIHYFPLLQKKNTKITFLVDKPIFAHYFSLAFYWDDIIGESRCKYTLSLH